METASPVPTSDPSTFWKLPALHAQGGAPGFTGLFYKLNQKQQLEQRALEKLSMKAEQLAAAINTPSKQEDLAHYFPYTYKNIQAKQNGAQGGPDIPRIVGDKIMNISSEDIRKTTGGGGYHQALMPYELEYAEKNNILVNQGGGDSLCTFDVGALRKCMLTFFQSYQGTLMGAELMDKLLATMGQGMMQGSVSASNSVARMRGTSMT